MKYLFFSLGVETVSKVLLFCFICYLNYLPKHVTQKQLYVFPLSLDDGWVSAHAEADERTVPRIFSHILTLLDEAFFNIFNNLCRK